MPRSKARQSYSVESSEIHGKGVFATALIRKGARIIEYRGIRSSMEAACERPHSDPANPYHTFIFELSDGTVIDGGEEGNDARWINHSCDPNCEAIEEDDRVFIHAKQTIRPGEELTYDYQLTIEGRISRRARKGYSCGCGTDACRGTLLIETASARK